MNKTFISLNTIKTLKSFWRFSNWWKYCRNSNLPQNRQWRNLISLASGKSCTKLKTSKILTSFNNEESHTRSKKPETLISLAMENLIQNLKKSVSREIDSGISWSSETRKLISRIDRESSGYLIKKICATLNYQKFPLNDCRNPHLSLHYIKTTVSFLIKHIQKLLILPY